MLILKIGQKYDVNQPRMGNILHLISTSLEFSLRLRWSLGLAALLRGSGSLSSAPSSPTEEWSDRLRGVGISVKRVETDLK